METLTSDGIRFTLRPYQDEAIARMNDAEARGVRKQLGVAATGLGKTVMFCAWAAQRGGRTLILAHRDELIGQAVKQVRGIWPGADIGVVKAEQNEVHAHVMVGSVQTLARPRRMDKLLAAEQSLHVAPLDLVIVDEAHHSAADSYRRIIESLGAGQPDGPMLLGVTATPDRGDGQGLDDLYDEIVWNYDILWGIRSGFLADMRAKKIVLDHLDLQRVRVRRGDYDAGSAGQALTDADAPAAIVKGWQDFALGRQTIVFTPTVALAEEVRDEFHHAGVRAAMVSGATPLEERRELLHRYATGEIQVVANCAVLTEGFDEPRTDCIVVARPTKSRALFTQMVGRGTRRHPDKDYLLVLDVVGASDLHSLVTVPSLFGLPLDEPQFEVGERNLTDAVDAFERHQVAVGKLKAIEADLFKAMRASSIVWTRVADEQGRIRYERSMGYSKDGEFISLPTVVLVQRELGNEDSWLCGLILNTGAKRVLIHDTTLDIAQGVGEDYARKALGNRTRLIDANAEWRKRRPSARQIAAARKWRIKNPEQYATAGELSEAIDQKVAESRNRTQRKGA